VDVHLHAFLTAVLDKDERLASRPGRLSQGKKAQLPITRMLGSSQSRSETSEEERNRFPLPEMNPQFLGRPVGSLVTAPNKERGFPLNFKVTT
jgi:hypothetical protein